MKHRNLISILIAFLCLGTMKAQSSSPLALNYSIIDTGATGSSHYRYDFNLVYTQVTPGDRFNWIVFGDQMSGPSPLADFNMPSSEFPIGPFTSLSFSGGYHNGPCFIWGTKGQFGYWTPTTIGESLSWYGFSSRFLGTGELLFSNANSSPYVRFATATYITGEQPNTTPVPEPSTYGLMGAGALAALGFVRRRSRK